MGQPFTKLGALTGHQTAWILQSLVLLAGTLAAGIGLAPLSGILQSTRAAGLARAGLVGSIAVAAVNAFIMLFRMTAPMDGISGAADLPSLMLVAHFGWLATVNVGLTLLTVPLYGAALFWTERAKVTGALVAALSLLASFRSSSGDCRRPSLPTRSLPIPGAHLLFWEAPASR